MKVLRWARVPLRVFQAVLSASILGGTLPVAAAVLDGLALLEKETFWDNRDWDWYRANIPFFDCPDPDITTTYYYRWELVTKHLTYGSPTSGYSYTEFIDRPFWSGAYGAISCPAGHQLYEVRWLKDPVYSQDYARYWFRTPGAQPRRYSCWLADAVWAMHEVQADPAFTIDLLPDLQQHYAAWEKGYFVPEVGLFWQNGHDDGMEYNINSRQTRDIVRGAPGYRPNFNAYMWADARAIARVAALAGQPDVARAFLAKADGLKAKVQSMLWDPERQFFFHMFKQDEERDGHVVKAMTLTHQSGQFAGCGHGRELIGYVPWQFNLPDPGYESAWKFLMDPDYFRAAYGPTTVERHDPMFFLSKSCCWWSGHSWPYATAQTLKALANLLQSYRQDAVTPADYVELLRTYARTHRKDGRPYLAEAAHPDTGSFEGHDGYNHSEHYFHSSYNDQIITGLVGLQPQADDSVKVHPLAPADWDYFALDAVTYHGHVLSVIWDREGRHYGLGPGFRILRDGQTVASRRDLGPLAAAWPAADRPTTRPARAMNFAVNNEGSHFPRITASHVHPRTSVAALVDGNYWYHPHPPNRWTSEGSPNSQDWCALDLGLARRIDSVKLYFLEDEAIIAPPRSFTLEYKSGETWKTVPGQQRAQAKPQGHRANVIQFPTLEAQQLRVSFDHAQDGKTGLTEWEVWGPAETPYRPAPSPAGNLALHQDGAAFPKVRASHTSRFDKLEMVHDGRILFRPTPHNRWTTYESPNAQDWLEVDFGKKEQVGRVDLSIYEDGGGVQAPEAYTVQAWLDGAWREVADQVKEPARPAGGVLNTVRFQPVRTDKLRVVFTHRGQSRSGLTEIECWAE